MNSPPWHEEHWQRLRQRLQASQLAHALMFAGPAGLGKRDLVKRLAGAALCLRPEQGEACGRCRACVLLAAGNHPDLLRVELELNTQGNLRKEIRVQQIRDLSHSLSMTSQLGGRQLAIIDPADAMNGPAANALLKTLEEPAADTVLILLADQPWRLPATVRSRCQQITLHLPSTTQALQWLRSEGIRDAEAALQAAAGNPGLARDWSQQGLLALRGEVHADLQQLVRGHDEPWSVSRRWADESAAQRLWFAARAANSALRARSLGSACVLGSQLDNVQLADWFDKANQAREDLRGPLRPELVVFSVLSAWR